MPPSVKFTVQFSQPEILSYTGTDKEFEVISGAGVEWEVGMGGLSLREVVCVSEDWQSRTLGSLWGPQKGIGAARVLSVSHQVLALSFPASITHA